MSANHHYPMPGVEIWTNEKNGFTVFQLHYSADPRKRGEGALKEIKDGLPIRRFNQEYEICWDSFEGLPVYADWDQNIHGVKGPIAPHIGLPLLLGLDFGLTPAAVICQLQESRLMVMKEYVQFNMGAERFMEWITPQLKVDFPRWADHSRDYIVFIDPSGQYRKDTDEKTCAMIVNSYGFDEVIPGPEDFEERRRSVEHFLTSRSRYGAGFQISMPNCPVLVRGFQGGYRYPDSVVEKEPLKIRPIKDRHSHPHDGLQMVAAKVLMMPKGETPNVPTPAYSFNRGYR